MAIPCELLLYPELLSNEQLIYIIQERHLRIENMERMSRCELIDLFRNFCVPYGQRKYRDSGRGKVLNKIRHFSPEPASKRDFNATYNSLSVQAPHSRGDRLKPPPEPLSGQLKRIKLDSTFSISTDVSNIKRKMSVDDKTSATDSPPHKKEKKKITWP